MRKIVVASVLTFTLLLCAGLAQAESTALKIIVRNNTNEPMSFQLSGVKHANGHLMAGQSTTIHDSQTAYFLDTRNYTYKLKVTYAYDKCYSAWITLSNTVDIGGTRVVKIRTWDTHNDVPWWRVTYSERYKSKDAYVDFTITGER